MQEGKLVQGELASAVTSLLSVCHHDSSICFESGSPTAWHNSLSAVAFFRVEKKKKTRVHGS